jgi:5,10-methylenetetrahydromethanopterin reductase
MTDFGLSLAVSPREPTSRVGSLAHQAEAYGFGALWLLDSQLLMRDAYVSLTAAAVKTKRLKLGTGVTNGFTRHLTVTANAISTLDELSGGRSMLGIGNGDSSLHALGLRSANLARMREQVLDLQVLLRGEPVQFDGHAVTVAGARPVPVFLAATRPRMLELAGEVADGVVLTGFSSPEVIRLQLDHIKTGLRRAGRSRESLFIDYWSTVAVADDEREALDDVKSWAASQIRSLTNWDPMPQVLQPFVAEARAARSGLNPSQELSRHASHRSIISDDFARMAAVVGPPERCAQRLAELQSTGVDRITMSLLSGGREHRLDRLGEVIAMAGTSSTRL